MVGLRTLNYHEFITTVFEYSSGISNNKILSVIFDCQLVIVFVVHCRTSIAPNSFGCLDIMQIPEQSSQKLYWRSDSIYDLCIADRSNILYIKPEKIPPDDRKSQVCNSLKEEFHILLEYSLYHEVIFT